MIVGGRELLTGNREQFYPYFFQFFGLQKIEDARFLSLISLLSCTCFDKNRLRSLQDKSFKVIQQTPNTKSLPIKGGECGETMG